MVKRLLVVVGLAVVVTVLAYRNRAVRHGPPERTGVDRVAAVEADVDSSPSGGDRRPAGGKPKAARRSLRLHVRRHDGAPYAGARVCFVSVTGAPGPVVSYWKTTDDLGRVRFGLRKRVFAAASARPLEFQVLGFFRERVVVRFDRERLEAVGDEAVEVTVPEFGSLEITSRSGRKKIYLRRFSQAPFEHESMWETLEVAPSAPVVFEPIECGLDGIRLYVAGWGSDGYPMPAPQRQGDVVTREMSFDDPAITVRFECVDADPGRLSVRGRVIEHYRSERTRENWVDLTCRVGEKIRVPVPFPLDPNTIAQVTGKFTVEGERAGVMIVETEDVVGTVWRDGVAGDLGVVMLKTSPTIAEGIVVDEARQPCSDVEVWLQTYHGHDGQWYDFGRKAVTRSVGDGTFRIVCPDAPRGSVAGRGAHR